VQGRHEVELAVTAGGRQRSGDWSGQIPGVEQIEMGLHLAIGVADVVTELVVVPAAEVSYRATNGGAGLD
jgi:hypothetical protein